MIRRPRSGRGLWMVGVLAVEMAAVGCETSTVTEPPPGPPTSTALPVPPGPGPWTPAEVREYPCAVLSAEEIVRFGLDPHDVDATPGRQCGWEALTRPGDLDGHHFLYFRPDSQVRYPDEIRPPDPPDLPETEIEIGGRRALLKPVPRADDRNGACVVRVWVPSGGSFEFQVRAGSAFIGVDWDVCARTIEVATAVSAHLR
ncbi:DUF3558 family protein [Nocardia wallacei]|uniref:DUF3558 family protein n=1 Tax=Nocardia wallacei TaxID=480035 RepID=UPI0024582F0D|nr:DUF3558 family protein [Nocardia wallacei]